jgi:YesN/AraC family two-component response regulator
MKLLLGKDHLETAEIAPLGSHLTARSTTSGMITSSEPALSQALAFDDDLPLLLIVEDNHDMRSYLRNLLSFRYRLIELPDGIQALETAKEKIPDLIICDVMMPGITGFELCDQLKTETMTCHIPVILLTAKADIHSRIEGLGKGADAYLSKPFEKEELLTSIKSLLELRKKLRERFQLDLTNNDHATELEEKEDDFIRDIRELILDNLGDPDFSISQICRKMGISRAQLYRKMTAITNDSVGNFILTVRLREAEKLLKTSVLNVSEVAYEVGFRDPAYFSRVFKKMYHASPSDIG